MPDLPSMFDAQRPTSQATAVGDYVQPTLNHALRIWWAFYWPNTLVSLVLSTALGGILRLIYNNTNVPGYLLRPVFRFGGYVVSYVVAIFVIYYILHKQFRHFRIVLLSGPGGTAAQELAATFGRAVKVWWRYVWRSILYFLISYVVVMLPLNAFVNLFAPGATFLTLFFGGVGFVVGGAIALYTIYSNILDENFGDFYVCLLARAAKDTPPAPAATSLVGS